MLERRETVVEYGIGNVQLSVFILGTMQLIFCHFYIRSLILLHINTLLQCLRDTFHHLVELRKKLSVTYIIAAGWSPDSGNLFQLIRVGITTEQHLVNAIDLFYGIAITEDVTIV